MKYQITLIAVWILVTCCLGWYDLQQSQLLFSLIRVSDHIQEQCHCVFGASGLDGHYLLCVGSLVDTTIVS